MLRNLIHKGQAVQDHMDMQVHAMLYGIGTGQETRPNFLHPHNWRMRGDIGQEQPANVCCSDQMWHVKVTVLWIVLIMSQTVAT